MTDCLSLFFAHEQLESEAVGDSPKTVDFFLGRSQCWVQALEVQQPLPETQDVVPQLFVLL